MTTGSFPTCKSGYLLGKLVDAFNLRAFDAAEAFSGKGARNASRYFNGTRVDLKSQNLVLHGIATALDESGLLPPLPNAAAVLPPLPPEIVQNASITHRALVEVMLRNFAKNWDETEGALQRLGATVGFPASAKGATARLVAVDLALRAAGLFWLARVQTGESLPIHWAEDNGIGQLLRERLAACSPRMTRETLAEKLKVSQNTVDSWLDRDARPSDENLQDLAELLGTGDRRAIPGIVRELRLLFGARELYRMLEKQVGPTESRAIAQALCELPLFFLQFPRSSRAPGENDIKMGAAALFGTTAPRDTALAVRRRKERGLPNAVELLELTHNRAVGGVLQSMVTEATRVAPDPVWATTLNGAASSWFDHLQWVARRLAPPSDDDLALMKALMPNLPLESIAYMAQGTPRIVAPPNSRKLSEKTLEAMGQPSLQARIAGNERAALDDLRGAAHEYRRAIGLDFEDTEAHFRLGCILWQMGELAEAQAELHLAVAQHPTWDRPRVELAIVQLNLGDHETALSLLEDAKRHVATKSSWVQLHLAYAHEMGGNLLKAIAGYLELLELEPANAEGHDRVAHLLLASGRKREGAAHAKRAHDLGFSDVFVAWEANYYNGGGITNRPPRCTPDELRQLD